MMACIKKALNDKLFLKINHVIWSIPCFFLAIWMLYDARRLINEPFQFVGVILLFFLGGVFFIKGFSNNLQSLKKTKYSPISDIFFFIFALISFVPSLIIWKTIKYLRAQRK